MQDFHSVFYVQTENVHKHKWMENQLVTENAAVVTGSIAHNLEVNTLKKLSILFSLHLK